jgi:polyisoprenoid-binding protein YceI
VGRFRQATTCSFSTVYSDELVRASFHLEMSFHFEARCSSFKYSRQDFGGEIGFDANRPEASSVDVRIDAASIDTGVPDRDAHLRSMISSP